MENKEWIQALREVRPSKRQLAWQQLEFTAFLVLKEKISEGQRVEKFRVEADGYRKIK